MLFSSIPFIYFFLPIVFAVYFIMPRRLRNAVLLIFSIVFYFYGEPVYVFLLLFSTVYDYIFGRLIDKYRGTRKAKGALIGSVCVNLSILAFFKYSDFIITNINAVAGTNIPLLFIPLPLGISFYTFQTMSYTIDLYRGKATVQKNPINFAAYVTMFPQLVAGPIVRYQTVSDQIDKRGHSIENFAAGATRFTLGLGKKVLIADQLGMLNATALTTANESVLMYWLAIISFMLQIYFDFSGYSDMAIGLARIFGFRFLENFNYPFIARSITDFWRRWHISMGTWFREYIYLPLGGNRVSRLKWARNIAIVWLCTGLWHGAAWNFVAWGAFFGVLLTVEKLLLLKWIEKIPRVFAHIYTLAIITISFVIFHFESVSGIIHQLGGMFGFNAAPLTNSESLYYLDSYKVLLIAAAIGATPLLKTLYNKAQERVRLSFFISAARPIAVAALLLIVTAYLIDSSFSPFLYFRF